MERPFFLFYFLDFRGELPRRFRVSEIPENHVCVVVCLSVRFLVGIFRGPVTPPRSGVAAAVCFLAFRR
jgi:hypothetical protein